MTTTTAPSPPTAWDRALHLQLQAAGAIAGLVTVIWAMAGAGYLWPMWVWIGLAIPLAFQYRVRAAWRSTPGARRRLRLHWAVVSVLAPLVVVIWAAADPGYFWPMWPLLGLGVLLAAHAGSVTRPGV